MTALEYVESPSFEAFLSNSVVGDLFYQTVTQQYFKWMIKNKKEEYVNGDLKLKQKLLSDGDYEFSVLNVKNGSFFRMIVRNLDVINSHKDQIILL